MSGSFTATAEAAVSLWEHWRASARARVYRDQIPSLLELQTVCRETGCSFPELDCFAGVLDMPPAFLLCGGDPDLASEIATVFGFTGPFPDIPDAPFLWWMQAGTEERMVFCLLQKISRKTCTILITGLWTLFLSLMLKIFMCRPGKLQFVGARSLLACLLLLKILI